MYVWLGVPLRCPPRQAHSPEELQVPMPARAAAQQEGLSRSPGIESLDELGHWLVPERIATMRGKEHTDQAWGGHMHTRAAPITWILGVGSRGSLR